MKLRDRVIEEIRRLPPDKIVLVSDLVSALGRQRADRSGGGEQPEIRARKALAGIRGSLSDDISMSRADRI